MISSQHGFLIGALATSVSFILGIWQAVLFVGLPAEAESSANVMQLPVEALPEGGCPVSITSARTEFDVDPFGVPLDAKIYIDYRNVSKEPVVGVKFRLSYIDRAGNNRGAFHAPHAAYVAPDALSSEKWRHTKIDPKVAKLSVLVLQVKFADGRIWQSSKMAEIASPASPP